MMVYLNTIQTKSMYIGMCIFLTEFKETLKTTSKGNVDNIFTICQFQ
jgi:hypothetical protein